MKKFLAVVITLVIIGLIGWRIYTKVSVSGKPENKTRRVRAVAVEVKPVRKADVRDIGDFTGTLLPRAKFIVAPKISGRLEKLLVNVGDNVKRGQLIAVLEDDEYLQQVNQAQAELDVVKAQLEESVSNLDIARREFDRARVLREKKIASASELDAAQAQFKTQKAKHKVAIAQVAEKEAALRAVRVRLSYTKIHANWEDGAKQRVIGERFRDEGAMLSSNAAIVSILDINILIGVIHIIEREIHEVCKKDFAIYDYTEFKGCLGKADEVLFIGDNAGESVFDRILMEELKKPVIYVVRGEPVINDVTYDDALLAGIDKVATIVSSGTNAPGTILTTCSSKFRKIYNDAKCVISKGQGNYEGLSDEKKPIFFMLKVKCYVIAKDIGITEGDIVLKGINV